MPAMSATDPFVDRGGNDMFLIDRSCGEVLCNKCCPDKMPLPQYGLDNPERVCTACAPVATSVTMSFSPDHVCVSCSISSVKMLNKRNF